LPNAIVVYLKACHRPRPALVLQIIHLVAVLALVASLAQWSALAAAIGAAGAAFLRLFVAAWFVVRADQVSVRALLGATLPMLAASLGMFAAVQAFHHLLGWSPDLLLLALEIVVGIVTYIALAFVLCPSVARDFIALIKKARQRGAEPGHSG
jgi:hypothetical protein